MVPFQVVMIPTLLIVKQLGLVDSLPALILPNLVTPFGIYLLRQFFLSLPAELEEAAIIDGAGRLRILFSILLPLMGPPLSTRRRSSPSCRSGTTSCGRWWSPPPPRR